MKECPVCNEVFTDEFKFCDLDGAKLRRRPGSDNSKWSNVGALLLLAAVILSVGFIFFFPRGGAPVPGQPEGAKAPAQTKADQIAKEKSDAPQEKTEPVQAEPKVTAPEEKPQEDVGAEPAAEPLPPEQIAQPQQPTKPPQPIKDDKKGGLYKAFKQIYGDN